MSRQLSTTVFVALPHRFKSYIVAAMQPIDMHLRTRRFRARAIIAFVSLQVVLCGGIAAAREIAPLPPSQLYGALFQRVQTEKIFADSKTFADAVAKSEPGEIVRKYEAEHDHEGFSLKQFVGENFVIPDSSANAFKTAPREEIHAHIDRLWDVLSRTPRYSRGASSQLQLSNRYVVPGGRFREMYYWDSYFTMVGLQASGRDDLVADLVENFSGLIDRYGHIPNGTRSYYLSRSQPPFFALMVELQAEREGTHALTRRLPQLEREYSFWMEGAEGLAPGAAHRRVVRLTDGSLLNRNWDDLAVPRDEAYREDLEVARNSGRPAADVYRDLRAAAESGWDFSSRWLADGKAMGSIRTTDLAPVDLNSLLYKLELVIARGCKEAKRPDCEKKMLTNARARRATMLRLMWDGKLNAFVDYDWRNQRGMNRLTAATVYPLFVGIASEQQVQGIAATIRATLLMPNGLATTTLDSGQQWDDPNGWAPLQWMAIDGLRSHGEGDLAADIAQRWVAENARVYCATGKLVEKYNVREAGAGAGGEYPVQDGFAWTNAVLIKLLTIYPELARKRYEFTGGACSAKAA
jgi:alpha,alpha-trehalase